MIKLDIIKFNTILFIVIVSLISNGCTETKADRRNLEKVSKLINDQKLDSALVTIQLAKNEILAREFKKGGSDNEIIANAETASQKFNSLSDEINNFRDTNYVNIKLASLSKNEIKMLNKNTLVKEYFNNENLNRKFISMLKVKLPNIKKISAEIKKKEKQDSIFLAERKKYSEENTRKEFEKKEREKIVEEQFNKLDGSHRALTLLIKKNMNDPDSYEHVSTQFRDDNQDIFVVTKFRGKNSFGGKVINTVAAKVDFNGNVIKIIEQK